jgi:hypothetical protein
MKLKDIILILNRNIEKLVFSKETTSHNGITYINAGNLNNLKNAILNIQTTGLASDIIAEIVSNKIFDIPKDSLLLTSNDANKLTNNISLLIEVLSNIEQSLLNIVGQPTENSIFIKLPVVNDFKDLGKAADAFEKILNQIIINDDINGEVRIESVENGSIWLEVSLGTSLAVSAIGSLAWAAAVVYKKMQEGRLLAQAVIKQKISNGADADLANANKILLNYIIEAEAQHFCEENYSKIEPEQIERVKVTIKMLAEQMSKGAEIHPSISTPEEFSNLFPNMNNLIGLASKIKQIEN